MIRAAMIEEGTGIVVNIIVATEEDFSARPGLIIHIPIISSKDGVLSFELGVNPGIHKWNGTMFTDLDGNELQFNPDFVEKINEHDKMLETEQLPPEVI